jgi:hypothetical protein
MKTQYPLKHHINFSGLLEFTGGNIEFAKNLVTAFLSEMEIFMSKIVDDPSDEAFVSFRKTHHSISPSLQMLGMNEISKAIEAYKTAYLNKSETFYEVAQTLSRLVQESVDEAKQWITAEPK